MEIELQTVIGVALPCLGGVVWLLRLENRVNLSEAHYQDLKADLTEIKDDLKDLTGRP